jgi:ubiquinone/menaquinone biosynthesis C-methylase UbiE
MQMVSIVKDQIRNYWEGNASSYDKSYGHGLKTAQEKDLWLNLLARNISKEKGAKILDVGCGTGFLSLLLAELGHTVTGIDLSAEMRNQATKKARQAKLQASFMAGDAESPPFPENSFDIIISRHLLWTLPSPSKALGNWHHLLSPGGTVIIIDGIWTPRNLESHIRFFLADLVRFSQGKFNHLTWTRKYASQQELPFFGGAEPHAIIKLMEELGYHDTWKDSMEQILEHERNFGPLDYRITYGKNRRYLIGGSK